MINLFSYFCYAKTSFFLLEFSYKKFSFSFLVFFFFFPFSLSLYSKSKPSSFHPLLYSLRLEVILLRFFFSIPLGILAYFFPMQFISHQYSFHIPHVLTYSPFFLCSIITSLISHATSLGLPLEFKSY